MRYPNQLRRQYTRTSRVIIVEKRYEDRFGNWDKHLVLSESDDGNYVVIKYNSKPNFYYMAEGFGNDLEAAEKRYRELKERYEYGFSETL